MIGYNPPSAPHPNDPSRTSVSGMGGKLAFLKSQGQSANACRVSEETAFSVPIAACPLDRCSSLQNALPVEGRLNSSHGDHSHSVHPVRTDGSTITELSQFVVSAGYRVLGCEIQGQFLCSPPCAMAPKGVIDGTCSQPLALGLSLSADPLSFPKHSFCLLVNCFLSISHLSSWVILSSDVTLDRGSLGPLRRVSSLR